MTVTLMDAVIAAIQHTETIPMAQSKVSQAQNRVEQAKSRFLPGLALGANYLKQDGGNTKTSPGTGSASSTQYYTRLTATQSFYAGGRDKAALEASQWDFEIQRQNLATAHATTFSNVARVFYGVLSSERDGDNLKKTIALAKDRMQEMEKWIKIGRSRSTDLLTAKAQLSLLESQLAAAEGQVLASWDQFVLYTDLPRDVKLFENKQIPETPQNMESYLEYVEKRPDVIAIKAQIEVIKKNIEMTESNSLPSLDGSGNYYLLREGSQKGVNWDVVVTLNFPFFNGGFTKAQVKENQEKLKEVEYLLQQTRRQGEVAIKGAHHNLISHLNQLRFLESALKFAEVNYRQQEKDYRFSQATNLDVIQALNTFQDTKRTFDKTRYLALAAAAELRAVTGQGIP